MLRGVLGTASWRAQQESPQFASDVGLLLTATAQPVVQHLLDANKLARDMRRSSAQSLHFFPSMRLRGNSWFMLRGPIRAIVPVQMEFGQEGM